MTQKDYIALANALRATRPHVPARSTKQQRAVYNCWHETRGRIMQALAADNYRFDRARFVDITEE